MQPRRIHFGVHGKPATQGSKRAFIGSRKDGSKFAAMKEDNPRLADWRQDVAAAAVAKRGPDEPLWTGPIRLVVTFLMARPKSHYRTGKNAGKLKASAPTEHTQTPDLSKMVRALEDALSGVVWRDDSQVCEHDAAKLWSDRHGAMVRIIENPNVEESEADDE